MLQGMGRESQHEGWRLALLNTFVKHAILHHPADWMTFDVSLKLLLCCCLGLSLCVNWLRVTLHIAVDGGGGTGGDNGGEGGEH